MREFEELLKANGYSLSRVKGGHYTFKADGKPRVITINKEMNRMMIKRLIKENNLKEKV
jgi:predicted RNA binding protein YcfA (HicA-like mRNA interferase family)